MKIRPVGELPPPRTTRIAEYDEAIAELRTYAGQWCEVLVDVDKREAEKWRGRLSKEPGMQVTRRRDGDLYSLYANAQAT